MKRRESKLPIVLTMIVLGYFVFWAIGYVGRNRPAPVQPVTSLPRPAAVVDTRPEEPHQVSPAPPSAAPEVSKPTQGPVQQKSSTNVAATDNSEEVPLSQRTQNRKLAGVLEDSTIKK
jgi:hypothetical protein